MPYDPKHIPSRENRKNLPEDGSGSLLDYHYCRLCPRDCRVDRHLRRGFCQCSSAVTLARAALHRWEEPCISGVHGSGTVFFSGCTLRCCFCQNYRISSEGVGKQVTAERLSEIFLELQDKKAHNINLVTADPYLPSVIEALEIAGGRLRIPVVYNCGGYETVEAVRALAPYVDVWLPDLKYYGSALSGRYSQAENYFTVASAAIREMLRLSGPPVMEPFSDEAGGCLLMKRGVIIRHMVLPGQKADSIRLLHWIRENLPAGSFLLSLMSQYTPFYKSVDYPELNRRITTYEYEKVLDTAIELGLTDGFMQEKSSAKEEYTPPFDLEGI